MSEAAPPLAQTATNVETIQDLKPASSPALVDGGLSPEQTIASAVPSSQQGQVQGAASQPVQYMQIAMGHSAVTVAIDANELPTGTGSLLVSSRLWFCIVQSSKPWL